MIITISGTAGSGKSTIAKMLKERLGYKSYYIGGIRRMKAKEHGMTLEEYNKHGEQDFSTDEEVDHFQKELGEKEDSFIIEGRISFHFIPRSIKIFIKCDLDVGAERIWNHIQEDPHHRNEAHVSSLEDVKHSLKERVRSDTLRYRKYYNIEVSDEGQYDLVVDTTFITAEEAADKILTFLKQKKHE